MGRGSILALAVSGVAVGGALATGPGLAFATAAAAVLPAASAAAPVWGTAHELPGITGLAPDDGAAAWTVSCSSPGNCAVGGSYGDQANSSITSAFVADQRNGSWRNAIEVPGIAALSVGENAEVNSVSCTSAGDCTAGGSYWPGGDDAGGVNPALNAFVVTEKSGTWGRALEVPGTAALNVGGSAGVSSVSCWSPGDCTAFGQYAPGGVQNQGIVDLQTFVVTETGGAWGTAEELPGIADLNAGQQAAVSSISCTPGGNCAVGGDYSTASGEQQAFVADETSGTWQRAEEVPGTGALDVHGEAGVTSISCASPGNCGATGTYVGSTGGVFVASEINGTWRTAKAVPDGVDTGSISCPSAGNCVAGGTYAAGTGQTLQAFAITELDGTWGSLQPVPGLASLNIGGSAGIESLSCFGPGDCGAGGYYAGKKSDQDQADDQAFLVTETDGTWGRAEQVPGIPALTATDAANVNAVSCTSPQACTATGSYGSEGVFVVSTTPSTATTESLSAAKVTDGREQSERVSATVTAKADGPPAGKVTVKAGSAALCAITLRSGRGSCTLTASRLRPGSYRLTAAYPGSPGSPGFGPSVSSAKTLTVVKKTNASPARNLDGERRAWAGEEGHHGGR
jgi:Bacterial Ig-like domain (group 3)